MINMKENISKKDVVIKIISIIIMALLGIALLITIPIIITIGTVVYYMCFDVNTIGTYTNEQNNYTIKYQEIGCAAFFGPTKVKVTLYNEKGRPKKWFSTKLFNDGKSPTDDNITIIWLEDRVKIIISGEEQSDYIQEMIY